MSKYKPTDAEIFVLGKYPNFSIASNKIPAKEIVVVIEVGWRKPDGEVADLLGNEVVTILQNAKP